jgi:hypothetical protein
VAVVSRILTQWSWEAVSLEAWPVALSLCIDSLRCLNYCCSKSVFVSDFCSLFFGRLPLFSCFGVLWPHSSYLYICNWNRALAYCLCVAFVSFVWSFVSTVIWLCVFTDWLCLWCYIIIPSVLCCLFHVACVQYGMCHKTVHFHVEANSEWS